MINFTKLRFKNFGSFGNSVTEIQFNKNELVLVSGLNGHGKSFAFLDAITFALFGKPFRKVNIPQLCNSINKKDSMVEVYFTIGKVEYEIKRGLNPKFFEIYRNGELIDQNAKSKDYQSLLEEQILKMNYKTFTQVVILGRSSFVPFMQLTPADRRLVIENILSINIFSVMHQNAKAKYSLVKEQMNDIQKKIETTKEKIAMQEKYISKLHEQKEVSETKINSEVAEYSGMIDELNSEVNTLSQSVVDDSVLQDQEETLRNKKSKYSSLKGQLTNKTFSCQEKVDFYEENSSCPTCKQGVEESFRLTQIDENKSKVKELEDALLEVTSTIKTVESDLKTLSSSRLDNNSLEKNIDSKKSLVKSHQEKIEKLKSDLLSAKNVSEEVLDEQKALEVLNIQKKEHESRLTELMETRNIYDVCVSLLKDSGIKSKVVKSYLPLINKVINTFLTNMNFFTKFELDEEFNEIIKSRFRDKFSYMSFSEGEKLRIDLALLFAWREVAKAKNSAHCNILILDEIFDSSLDSVGTDELMKNLNFLKKDSSVFVISHKLDQMSDKFDKTVVVKKKNNFSRIT